MRVTFLSSGRDLIFNLRQAQARLQRASGEISSGLRVTKPSDAPADAAQVVRTSSELARIEQFQDNLGAVQAELRSADGALTQAGVAISRALQLAVQAANTTQDRESRNAIQVELEGILRHLASIANTRHGGQSVFAGSAVDEVPFEIDESAPSGVVYRGDSFARAVNFPDGRPAQVSLPGDRIFLRPDSVQGLGRTPGTTGSAIPDPPAGVGVAFSGDVDGAISVDIGGFFVASVLPGVPAGGETITVNFSSADGAINGTITTPPLTGGETAAEIAAQLNAEVANDPDLAGGFTFSDEGGRLKLVQSDRFGVGFTFSASATGGLVTGLEAGGVTGGQSAEEITEALNSQVDLNPQLAAANVTFRSADGEVQVDADVDVALTVVDFDRGTGFRSGLAGEHLVGGVRSANIFGVLHKLIQDLAADDLAGIEEGVSGLHRAVDKVGLAQGFYGSTLRQIEITLTSLSELDTVNQQRLSDHQDADMLDAIGAFTSSASAEQFALQVAARRQPTLLDLLA